MDTSSAPSVATPAAATATTTTTSAPVVAPPQKTTVQNPLPIDAEEPPLPPTSNSNANNYHHHDIPSRFQDSKVLKLRGLPFSATVEDVRIFFKDFSIDDEAATPIVVFPRGRYKGQGFVRLISYEECERARSLLHRENMGDRYVEVFNAPESSMDEIAALYSRLSSNPNHFVRVRGLPYSSTEADILEFFGLPEHEVVGVRIVLDDRGMAVGDAFLEVRTEEAAQKALTHDRGTIGTRYVELSISSPWEEDATVYYALQRNKANNNRFPGMDMRGGGRGMRGGRGMGGRGGHNMMMNGMEEMWAATMQGMQGGGGGRGGYNNGNGGNGMYMNPMMSQMLMNQMMFQMAMAQRGGMRGAGGHGTYGRGGMLVVDDENEEPSFVVRVRGLPFAANEEQVGAFFADVEIAPRGVHMVLNDRGRNTGEAFVEVKSEEDITKALAHDKGLMGTRYIEVFRSSFEDMGRVAGGWGAYY